MSSPVVAAPSSVLSGTATGRQHAAIFKHRSVRSCVAREARGGSRARRHGGARPRLAARLTLHTATQLWPHAIGCERIARAMDSNAKRSSDEARAHMNDTAATYSDARATGVLNGRLPNCLRNPDDNHTALH